MQTYPRREDRSPQALPRRRLDAETKIGLPQENAILHTLLILRFDRHLHVGILLVKASDRLRQDPTGQCRQGRETDGADRMGRGCAGLPAPAGPSPVKLWRTASKKLAARSVGTTLRPRRSNSLKPIARSRSEISRLTEGWLICSIAAAAVIPPLVMTARNASTWRICMNP